MSLTTVSCSMKSCPSLYCKLHFKCYMSIDFHVNGCSLWPDRSCKRHLCDMLGVTESVPSKASPEVRKELHMWPHLYSKSVGNQAHLCLVTVLLQYWFFMFALCYGKMTKRIPCSCLCKDSSHHKRRRKGGISWCQARTKAKEDRNLDRRIMRW